MDSRQQLVTAIALIHTVRQQCKKSKPKKEIEREKKPGTTLKQKPRTVLMQVISFNYSNFNGI